MGVFVLSYKDVYGTGSRRVFHIPTGGSNFNSFNSGNYYTITDLIEMHYPTFDDTYTYFTNSQSNAESLTAAGYTDVFVLSENAGRYYLSETEYIDIPTAVNGQWNYHYNNEDHKIKHSNDFATTLFGKNETGSNSSAEVRIYQRALNPVRWWVVAGTVSTPYYNVYNNAITPGTNTDPYEQGGTSGPGGGTGTFDLASDAIDFPALPTLTAVSTGLVSIYTPTLAQVNALASYMWNANPTDIDWWKKLVANPLDLILGFSIVPVQVPRGATNNVKVGLIDTGVSMTRAASQFVEVDCGSIEIKEFYGAALDYLPYRKTSIYLPFIGTRTISTDDIMNKTVSVKYHVDLLSGACTAMVKCGDAVLYQYSGACAVSLPLTGETFTNMITSTIQLAASAGGAVALGGAAAAGPVAGAAISGGASLANSVISSKPTIERAGGVSGAAGQLGIMTPYLIGEIPRQSVAENYNTFVGYPSNIKATLADLSGFTTVESIHLQGIPATSTEYAEIERLLKEGVIL